MRRSEKLRAIGSEATFFSGLARIDGEFRSVRVAVTAEDFVLLDDWTNLDPDTELARLPRESIADVVIVDENGNEVADQLISPIRELETPEEERYAVVLKRHDAGGKLAPASFLFRSGEPALECRDRIGASSGHAVDRSQRLTPVIVSTPSGDRLSWGIPRCVQQRYAPYPGR
jgi:hypothetical protein